MRKILLSFILLVSPFNLAPGLGQAAEFYVAPLTGNDQNTGAKNAPFRTIQRAMKAVDGIGGTVHLTAEEGFYREQILIQKGGTETQRLVIEGNDATINLGTDVTEGPWTKLGEGEYRLEKKAPRHVRHYVTSPLFINGLPITADHPAGKGRPASHGGQLSQDAEDRFIVKFPRGLTPENSVVIMTSRDFQAGVQCNSSSHIDIRNLNIAFVGNDAYNFHGHSVDVTLENITALFNGDQGISSHETCEVSVKGGEVAFNGSQSGGIVDINDTKTTYTDMVVHHNRNHGLTLVGAQHKLEGIISYGHSLSNLPKASSTITINHCQDLGVQPETKTERDDVLKRFLALRP